MNGNRIERSNFQNPVRTVPDREIPTTVSAKLNQLIQYINEHNAHKLANWPFSDTDNATEEGTHKFWPTKREEMGNLSWFLKGGWRIANKILITYKEPSGNYTLKLTIPYDYHIETGKFSASMGFRSNREDIFHFAKFIYELFIRYYHPRNKELSCSNGQTISTPKELLKYIVDIAGQLNIKYFTPW